LEEKVKKEKGKVDRLKDKMQKECIDNKNFIAIVEKYKSIIRNLEIKVSEENNEKAKIIRNCNQRSDYDELTPRFKHIEIAYD
jgi:hypothetical protein